MHWNDVLDDVQTHRECCGRIGEVAVRTHMTGKHGPPLGVGASFPLRKERGGGGRVEKNFSTLYAFFEIRFPLA
jgi:hypothetical protein